MDRRKFLKASSILTMGATATFDMSENGEANPFPSPPPLAFQGEKSKLKITGVRMVRPQPKRPMPRYTPAAGSWSASEVEVASPMSIYPEYKAKTLWNACGVTIRLLVRHWCHQPA